MTTDIRQQAESLVSLLQLASQPIAIEVHDWFLADLPRFDRLMPAPARPARFEELA